MIKFKPLTEQAEWIWFKERTHVLQCEDSQGIVAIDDKGVIKAVSVFDSFTPDACSVHLAIDSPIVIRSGFIHELARYLFIQSNRKRIFGTVPANNKKALKLNAHLGWVEVARIPHGITEEIDLVVLCMEKEDCKWITQDSKEEAA